MLRKAQRRRPFQTSVSSRLAGICALLAVVFAAPAAHAHVGSSGVYAEGDAGPYKLFVTVQPPGAIPGVADVQVRTSDADIRRIRIVPVPLTGEASKHPPVPDTMRKSDQDAEFYGGSLWIMAGGSWQIRFLVDGSRGPGELAIPLAAAPTATLTMQPALKALLAILGSLLVLGMAGIVGAGVREGTLAPGAEAPAWRRRRARWAMAAALVILVLGVWLGGRWWHRDAANYAKNLYKPLQMDASLLPGNTLDLALSNPAGATRGWMRRRQMDDFILDHGHLMHLYMIREPEMDVVYHLHPRPAAEDHFRLELPSMPAGTYRLYADVVHSDGFPETLVATVTLPVISGRALSGDDAAGTAPPLSRANEAQTICRLPDGYVMVWARPPVLKALHPEVFDFYLLDPRGHPPADMALYMGMLGHAAFVRADGQVFAHIHPSGTAAMAAMMMAQGRNPEQRMQMPMPMQMPMDGGSAAIPNKVGFPYGFPTAGKYRIFVQMKHGDTIETGSFDADVTK
jgi:hypothetical protein